MVAPIRSSGRSAGRPLTRSSLERAAGGPLRWLTRLGGGELVDRLGLRDATERALRGVGAATGKLISRPPRAGRRAAAGSPAQAVERPAATRERTAAASAGAAPARLAPVASLGTFDLAPSEDQEMIRATARRFAEDILRPAGHAADAAAAPDERVIASAHELGLAALVIPEAAGGVAEARASVTTALVIEELARGDMGLALAVLAPLGVVGALVEHGSAAQQAEWLPRFVGDRFVPAALALLEAAPGGDPARPATAAVRAPGGWCLHGEKTLVPLGETAAVFAVLADIRGAGPRLFLVPKATPGVSVTREPAMGLRAAGLSRVAFDGAFVPDSALVGGEGERFDARGVIDRARVAWGAMAVGGVRAVLDYVIPYCNERKAFGEPVSHRQSIAFMIADLAIELEGMRLLVHRAASLADRGDAITREAALVRVQCSSKGMKAGSDGVQLLGGHGFVKEHPVERWYRDLRAIGVMEGALLA